MVNIWRHSHKVLSIHGQYSQLQHVQHVQRVSTVPQAQAPSLLALLASIVTVLTPIPLSVPEEHMEQPQAWHRRQFVLNAQLVKLAPNLAWLLLMASAMLGISVQVEPGLQDQALLTLLKQQLVGFVPPVLTVHPVLPPLRDTFA